MDVNLPPALVDLLGTAIDFAGLFPPAALPMDRAVADYLAYRASPDNWALGLFIAPAARLEELLSAIPAGAQGLRVSATIGTDLDADWNRIAAFNQAGAGSGHQVTAAELKVPDAAAVLRAAERLRSLDRWYGEVAFGDTTILDALVAAGGRAKIRMGGVTAEAFPSPAAVAEFLVAAAARKLPFKATAGLHHPVRGTYRLTYAPDAPSGTMYGYLNLLAAARLASEGAAASAVESALTLPAGAFRVEADTLAWPGGRINHATAVSLRRAFHGFGSCSFREPIDELLPAIAS